MDLLSPTIDRKTLRPYQSDCIGALRSSFQSGKRRVVLQLATGAGKTFLAASIINMTWEKNPDARVLFTVPMLNLIPQTIAAFRDEGISNIGIIQGSNTRNTGSRMVIASVQTLAKRGDGVKADLIIVDEAHIGSEGILILMRNNPNARFVGLSATPWRLGMGEEWDDYIVAATSRELIDLGMLVDFRVFAADMPDMSGAKMRKTKDGDYDYSDKDSAAAMKSIVGNIVQTWLERGENQPTLLFAVDCRSAKDLHGRFISSGIAAGYMDAHTDAIERAHIKREFEAGNIKIVCSVRTMTTGVDLPVGCIIDAAPTGSEMLHVQKIGRGLRVNPGVGDGEGRCIILDHAGNTTGRNTSLGFVTDIHYEWFLDGAKSGKAKKKKPLPKPCPKCKAIMPAKVSICPACGHERQLPPVEQEAEGDLQEIGYRGKKNEPTKDEKQKFYSMALAWADARGWPEKRAAGMYNGKFGVWPHGLRPDRLEPDTAFYNYDKGRRIAYAKKMEAEKRATL